MLGKPAKDWIRSCGSCCGCSLSRTRGHHGPHARRERNGRTPLLRNGGGSGSLPSLACLAVPGTPVTPARTPSHPTPAFLCPPTQRNLQTSTILSLINRIPKSISPVHSFPFPHFPALVDHTYSVGSCLSFYFARLFGSTSRTPNSHDSAASCIFRHACHTSKPFISL